MPIPSTIPQSGTNRLGREFSHKIQAGFWLVGAILLLIGLVNYLSLQEYDETIDWAAHSQEVLGHLQVVLSDMQDIDLRLRGYIMTGKERLLEPYKNGLGVLNRDREQLSSIIYANPQDPPEQPRNLEMLAALIDKTLGISNTMIVLRKDVSYQSAQMESYMAENKELMDSIRALIEDMERLERARLIARDRYADDKGKNAIRYFIVGVMMEIMILVWTAWQIRREITQRQQTEEALLRVHGELDLRIQERTKALVESNEHLRELSHRLMNVQETERRRIAHDLHDEIGQSLTAMKLGLREVNSVLESGSTASLLTDSLNILDQVIRQVRSLALNLRPSLLDELGLVPALKWYIKGQGERAGWETEYSAYEGNNPLSPEIKITCFRIAQEALTNIARYAEATYVRVTLERQGDRLVLTIDDNGKGFNVEQAKTRARTGSSIGLLGMEERARLVGGEMTITSSPKAGTRLTLNIPLVELHPQLVASEERMSR
ncbi:MAG: CHASE3 domain-containing protein [Nitrospirota bacterium]